MWNRRSFLFKSGLFTSGLIARAGTGAEKPGGPRVAITIDDFGWRDIPQPWRAKANGQLLGALDSYKVKAAGFVTGKRTADAEGIAIVRSWSDAGHLIANHTWSHFSINSPEEGLAGFERDMLRNDRHVRQFASFRPFFRFPALKEGNTAELRDGMRAFLHDRGYRNGHVTIDASDWYYDQRLKERLAREPDFDVNRFREPYLAHIAGRAQYYSALAREALRRDIPHTLLIHYNLINTLFLGDVLAQFRSMGWRAIDAAEAFDDRVFLSEPKILPAGESLVWALAKETGRFDGKLRYPGEDDVYEKPILDKLGL